MGDVSHLIQDDSGETKSLEMVQQESREQGGESNGEAFNLASSNR